MTPRIVRLSALVAVALAAGLPRAAGAQTIGGSFRGRVTGSDGQTIAQASVIATNRETGVSRTTLTGADGRYLLQGLALGSYAVRAQAIGHRPLEKTGFVLHVGEELIADFTLEAAAVQLGEIAVVTEQAPLIDMTKTGVSTRVSDAEIHNLPANGRNFTDFLNLVPNYVKTPNFGSGGTIGSLGGARSSGGLFTIDGARNTGDFFGGDPRGSDRLPIAFSIEAVKEFQVSTNEYDVSKGGFTGGLVNAVTKSGTNEFHWSAFEYFRNQGLTGKDYLQQRVTDFRSHQFGATVSGPIVKNKAHFFVAVDRQARTQPVIAISSVVTGIPDSTLGRLDSLIRNVYSVDPGQTGSVPTVLNEWALFGRIDLNLNERHRLAVRDNVTLLDLQGDRISPGSSNQYDYSSNGGPQKPKANSFVVSLFSNLSSRLYNEFRFQVASDHKRRPPGAPYPQVRVFLGGHFLAFGADSIIQFNNLEENTLQFTDILSYARGRHSFQLGTDNVRGKYFNLFFNNGLGTFTYNWGTDQATLDSMAVRHASAFTRSIGIDTVTIPTADYSAWNYSAFLQDKWQATDRLAVNVGIRLDIPAVSGTPRNSPALLDSFPQFFAGAASGVSTGFEVPARHNWAPRAGFSYDLFGDQRTVIRGGAGLFYGYTPFVYWSNIFLNTGRDQLTVSCGGATTATQNVDLNATPPVGCGAASVPVATAMFFAQDFKTPKSAKWSLGFDHGVTRTFAVGADISYSKTTDNYSIKDINYRSTTTAILTGEGSRLVVGTAPAAGGSGARRIDTRFAQVLLHDNRSTGDYWQLTGTSRWRANRIELRASYTYSRARDDMSVSCCTSTTTYRLVEAGTNINNDLTGNFNYSDNDRPHNFTLSGIWSAPLGIRFSWLLKAYSGVPFSPVISSAGPDANGDGIRGNDRAYIPRNRADISIDGNGGTAGLGTPTQQDSAYGVLDGIINRTRCLASQRGRIAARNTCRHEARAVLDIRFAKEVGTFSGQRVEIIADLFNVLNGINHNWGRATTRQVNLLRIRDFDSVNNRYVYEVDRTFGQKFIEVGANLSQFQAQLGVRYSF